MKMREDHYNALKALIYATRVYTEEGFIALQLAYISAHESGELKADDIHRRFRWDMFGEVPHDIHKRIMDDLYEYLNDDHIDTALKKIIEELIAEEGASTPMETV